MIRRLWWLGKPMPPIRTRQILTPVRKRLRHAMTKPEIVLWSRLKGRGFLGLKFRRQHSIGHYIVDFYCHALYLAVEVDGGQHFQPENMKYDQERTRYLNSLQILVVRFTNDEVMSNLGGVLEELERIVTRRRRSWPPPFGIRRKTPP